MEEVHKNSRFKDLDKTSEAISVSCRVQQRSLHPTELTKEGGRVDGQKKGKTGGEMKDNVKSSKRLRLCSSAGPHDGVPWFVQTNVVGRAGPSLTTHLS